MTKLKDRAIEALNIIERYNPLRNDLDAYLLEVCKYGLGLREDLPEPKDYGLSK
jgi:hypothetical protein